MRLQYRNVFFTTATILNWKPILCDDYIKDIIINGFRFAVDQQRAQIWAFVIMENHFHIVWYILEPFEVRFVVRNLLKFTAHQIIQYYDEQCNREALLPFIVNKADRKHQIWQRNALSVELLHEDIIWQKINYIHNNRSRKGDADIDYKYSSARYFSTGEKDWDFLI